ncbi:GTPase, G3E family [Paenibacillus sophorae]|uniref:GTP-binding protein n=1 Tax=Paenibacillus sophorae TaxID=1333845 RepID=A0A1H8G585_9BACL|nr:CobW family GTP-binding protein [Paenibacillus sophorae]QWU14078.1 GTP-binding protein [Paenibacillus sophorae]SEN38458.1 GTPase, G3E family [Paenibacillus sophorae]
MDRTIPVYILSGFLGSGKTTLLYRLLQYWKDQDMRPAVVMNELGEVNFDGMMVDKSVPMAELLGGCICCSASADLSMELNTLVKKESPDVIVIEATGAANPLDIIDNVTETSLYSNVELKGLITVVDAAHLLQLYREQKGASYRLMQEQIRSASVLILNKTDRVSPEEAEEVNGVLRKWNAFAEIIPAVRCEVDPDRLIDSTDNASLAEISEDAPETDSSARVLDEGLLEAGETITGDMKRAAHDHVMAYTHFFKNPINSVEFEAFIKELPGDVYRAKGVLTFNDTSGRFLFQYAYRESDFLKINPQGEVTDVAVFIGEHFSSGDLRKKLLKLEGRGLTLPGTVKRSL